MHDLGVRIEHLLDLAGEELLPPAVDDLLAPADDLHVAGAVHELAEVAAAEPALGGERIGVGLRIVVVAQVDAGSERRDLPDGAGGNVGAGLIHEPQPHLPGDAADRSIHLLGIVGEARVGVEAGLQHAVELDEMPLHPLLIVADGLDRSRGATGDDDAEGGQRSKDSRPGSFSIATIEAGAVAM